MVDIETKGRSSSVAQRERHRPIRTCKINLSQVRAIGAQELEGQELGRMFPEIAARYRNGATTGKLANEYRTAIDKIHPSSQPNGRAAVIRFAIITQLVPNYLNERREGRKADDIPGYGEVKNLGKAHMRTAGLRARDERFGIFGMPPEVIQEARRRGALQGQVPISPYEKEYVMYLHTICRYTEGKHKGMPNWRLISEQLQQETGVLRSPVACKAMFFKQNQIGRKTNR